jgi:mannonate dehydratase
MDLIHLRTRIEDAGLRLSVIEGGVPLDQITIGGPGRDAQIEQFKKLIRNIGAAEIPVVCYNFMPQKAGVLRTSYTIHERGGALVTGFDADLMKKAPLTEDGITTDEQMWENLAYFLKRIIPVAEEAGVKLAMHPDDPPMSPLCGLARIMRNVENFDRLIALVPSPCNGITFCQGCFAEMGVDIPATIRHFARHIHFVHFRDVRGTIPKFHETFHDNGKTDMLEAMRTYKEIGYAGVMRPDHVPLLEGEVGPATGYTMMGRLFAVGYMKGLMEAVGVGNGDRREGT